MHHLTRASRLIACSLVTLSATSAFAAGPDVIKNARHDTSLSLAQLATGPGATLKQTDREMAEPRATRAPFASGRADAVAAPLAGSLNGVSTVIGFDGSRPPIIAGSSGLRSCRPTPMVR